MNDVDADALFARGIELETRARELDAEAGACLERAAAARSLDARMAVARRCAERGAYDWAEAQLDSVPRVFADAPARRLITTTHDVLEPDAATAFTIITAEAARALPILSEVAKRFYGVDEAGVIHDPDTEWPDGADPPFTPKYVEMRYSRIAVRIACDTEGEPYPEMRRTMVALLVDALAAARITAVVAGAYPGLEPDLFPYEFED